MNLNGSNSEVFTMRFDAETRAALEKLAQKMERTQADVIRRLVRQAAKRYLPQPEAEVKLTNVAKQA